MHKEFYASGFIYHPPTEQILLQQYPVQGNFSPFWTLFGGVGKQNETPLTAFRRIITEQTGLPLAEEHCFSVYDYFHTRKNMTHYIHYAVVEEVYEDDDILTENKTAWFPFKKLPKIDIKPQTRQDITVGQRVINLALRQLQEIT